MLPLLSITSAPISEVTRDLYTELSPYDAGKLSVSEIHSIAFWQYGNPTGKPVLYIHGGPGGGTSPTCARFFDPNSYRIILVDQRGCGESTPFAELRENTTYDCINDFEQLRVFLEIDKWQIFGGSWGSTLGLAYAIEHPQSVTELVLRGIWLCRQREVDWMYQGPGASCMFPEDWALYENAIPPDERSDFMAAYGRRLRGEMGEEEMKKAAVVWSTWEERIGRFFQADPSKTVGTKSYEQFCLAFARIENHYFTNKGFFPRDGFLLEEENLSRIRHIPTIIVQGRYDVVCPPTSAYELHRRLPDSKLIFTIAGHSAFDTETIKQLVSATDNYRKTVT